MIDNAIDSAKIAATLYSSTNGQCARKGSKKDALKWVYEMD